MTCDGKDLDRRREERYQDFVLVSPPQSIHVSVEYMLADENYNAAQHVNVAQRPPSG